MPSRLVLIIALLPCCVGCFRRSDLNATCTWPADGARRLDLTNAADRDHLAYDAQLGEELGIRYGDWFRGRKTIEERGVERTGCIERLYAHIESIHGVSRVDVLRARDRRDLRTDIVAVFLPMAAVFALLADFISRRVFRRFTPDERWARFASLVALSLIGSVLLLLVGTIWSGLVEGVRLSDQHLSDRNFRLPWVRHPFVVLGSGVAVFWLVTARRWSSGARSSAGTE